MDKKDVWRTIGLSALTSVIVFFVLAQVFGAPLFSPSFLSSKQSYSSGTGEINANECTRDSVCEMNSADIAGTANIDGRLRFFGPGEGYWQLSHTKEGGVDTSNFGIFHKTTGNYPLSISYDDDIVKISEGLEVLGDLKLGADALDCAVIGYDDESASGDETCGWRGYDFCVIGEGIITERYYSSTDRSCVGLQSEMKHRTLIGCPTGYSGGGGGSSCKNNSVGEEPYFGDFDGSISQTPTKVLCCR